MAVSRLLLLFTMHIFCSFARTVIHETALKNSYLVTPNGGIFPHWSGSSHKAVARKAAKLIANEEKQMMNPRITFPRIIHRVVFHLNQTRLKEKSSYKMVDSYSGKQMKLPNVFAKNTEWLQEIHAAWQVRTYDWEGVEDWLEDHREELNNLLSDWLTQHKEALEELKSWRGVDDDEPFDVVALFLLLNFQYGAMVADLFRYMLIAVEGGVYMDAKGGPLDHHTFEDVIAEYPNMTQLLLLTYSDMWPNLPVTLDNKGLNFWGQKFGYKYPSTKEEMKMEDWVDKYDIRGLRDVWAENEDGTIKNCADELAQYSFMATAKHPLMKKILTRILDRVLNYLIQEYYEYGVAYEHHVQMKTGVREYVEIVVHDNSTLAKVRYEEATRHRGENPTWEKRARGGDVGVFDMTGPTAFGEAVYFGIAELVKELPNQSIGLRVAPHREKLRRCEIENYSCPVQEPFGWAYTSKTVHDMPVGPELVDALGEKKKGNYGDIGWGEFSRRIFLSDYRDLKTPLAWWDPHVALKVRDGASIRSV